MGQKINQNILRLGKVKEWKSKYVEKKKPESSVMIFQSLEIEKFVKQLFNKYDLNVQNCRVYYSESSLHVYISYHNSAKSLFKFPKKEVGLYYKGLPTNLYKNKASRLKQKTLRKKFYSMKSHEKAIANHPAKSFIKNHHFVKKKTWRLNTITNFKNYTESKKSETLQHQQQNLFLSKILKSLSLFTCKKCNIFLNLKNLNKETKLLNTNSKMNKPKLKKKLIKLRKYQKNHFFTEGFDILYNFVKNHQNPSLLSNFVAVYLRRIKRPMFFLRFLKSALNALLLKSQSKLNRIQIKIKGRFNGAPRAKHKFFHVGKHIPNLKLNSVINFSESTSYTANGTFGVKVWAHSKL